MRRCGWCNEDKPEGEFYRQASGRFLTGCKACRKTLDRVRRRQGDPAKKREAQRAYRARHPEVERKRLRRERLKRYGLTPEQYDERLSAQSGKCAACDTEVPLVVDHDHETNEVRGLLCHWCNTALGLVKDDPDRLMALVAYLLQSRAYTPEDQ